MSEKDLKLTDLDYATGDHHLQMMKAALPYLDIRRQRSLSMFIRAREMMHTMEFFRENDDGMMSVCSLESPNPSVEDMLSAVRPYANKAEQDTIDMISRFLAAAADDPVPGSLRNSCFPFFPRICRHNTKPCS